MLSWGHIQEDTTKLRIMFTLFENQMNIGIGQVSKMPSKYLIMYNKKKAVSINKNSENVDSEIKSIVESFAKGDIAKGI